MHRICRIILLTSILPAVAVQIAAAADEKKPADKPAKFELRDGDRVVFLGNTLIERAQKYGYWETLLTAQYPDRDITFRNLGWSGDTVWAESRGMFDPPEVGYKRMIEHVGRLKPTVIFLGYGNNEAFAGKEGLPAFVKQYDTLLDDLTRVSAEGVRFVNLSPPFVAPTRPPLPNQEAQHSNRTLYRNAISEIARRRRLYFVDLLEEMELNPLSIESCGVYADAVIDWRNPQQHLSEDNLSHIAEILRKKLFEPKGMELFSRSIFSGVGFNRDGSIYARSHISVKNAKANGSGLVADLTCPQLDWRVCGLYLGVSELLPGKYEVRIDGKVWRTVDHVKLHRGVCVESDNDQPAEDDEGEYGPNVLQLGQLRDAIIEKNRLYFHRWRPQNVTYLFGFRKHEQGQNAKELAEFDKLIAAKEQEINRLKKPVAHTYEIIRVKEKKRGKAKGKPER